MVMPDVLNSNCSSSSLTSNNQSSTMINHHHHHHPMSSLSTTDEYSSRYSSLQDSESLKSAILDSFRMHWIQAWSIMECKILNDITIDDLSSIVNHIEQMISLLMEENVNDVRTAASMSDIKTEHTSSSTTSENSSHHSCSHNANNSMIIESSNTSSLSPLMEFLSNESILEKIFQWSEMSGEWKNAMYLEQLKLYELLISQLCQTDIVLFKPSFFQPLIYLLESLSTFLMTNYTMMNNYVVEIEKRLVLLLNTLCVIISQNNRLLNVFIINQKYSAKINNPNTKLSSSNDIYDDMILNSNHHKTDNTPPPKQQSSLDSYNQSTTPYCDNEQTNKNEENDNQDDCENFSFPLFSLLIQFVHRDGPIGQQSRDAILLCLAMSRHDERLAYFVANKTDFCPILATGLSGHFSSLPRVLIAANNNDNNNNNQSFSINSKINTEQYQSYQFKHELLTNSKEIDHFLKCLDFCNAVVQMSHPIIQVQLLKYTFNGFLISVIGPALHQDVANVSINDLETLPSYSNTLDEIITTTAYLDLFIRTTSEPKLIRIFLEFLCFEVYDNNFIISTLINRITAKSKLSLVTLIFFKTLLDLNCEDLLYELIFKHLMRGRHLKEESHVENNMSSKHYAQSQSYLSYQKNWLAISAQKLLSTSISYYLNSLCPHQMNIEVESISSIESNSSKNCKCHSDYFLHYIDYLNDARQNLEQCHLATKTWRNSYNEPCHLLNEVHDENIIFCTIDRSNLNGNNNNNVNDDNNDLNHDDCDHKQQHQSIMTAMMGDDIIDINDIITQNTLLAKFSPGFKMKNCYYDFKLKKINYKVETNKPSFFGMMNILSNNNNGTNNDWSEPSPIGSFLTVLFMKFEKFFENEVITNLHLTGLLTRLCHFHHKLLLSLLFDETLSRTKNVPCFIHLVQKLSIEAQNYCDEIPDFETVFQAAKSNLQSMPLGEVDCSLLVGNNSGGSTNLRSSSNASSSNETNNTGSQHKAFGLLKNLFFRSTNSSSSTSTTLNRRPSNASIVSSTGQMLEVVPGGIRFINQTLLQQQREIREQRDQAQNVNRFNQLVYNLIVFDEFLMELSAILIEHSLRYIEN